MTKENMTIHKALSELKTLDTRINKLIDNAVFVVTNKHENKKIRGIEIVEYEKVLQGNYDQINDLIKRRNAIKTAVILSNATTKVTIGEITRTVAEWIEWKNHGFELQSYFVKAMKTQYTNAISSLTMKNEALGEKADRVVTETYGSKEKAENNENMIAFRKDWIERNTIDLVNPVKIEEKYEALETEILTMLSEIDSALSTSNALTTIDVEY